MLDTDAQMQHLEQRSIFEQSQCVSAFIQLDRPDGFGSAQFTNVRILTLESDSQLNMLSSFPNLFQLSINNCKILSNVFNSIPSTAQVLLISSDENENQTILDQFDASGVQILQLNGKFHTKLEQFAQYKQLDQIPLQVLFSSLRVVEFVFPIFEFEPNLCQNCIQTVHVEDVFTTASFKFEKNIDEQVPEEELLEPLD